MTTPFVAFIPLSNWLRGFDRYAMKYSKALISESSFPDAFYMLREDEPRTPGLEKARRLIQKLGRKNDRLVALRCAEAPPCAPSPGFANSPRARFPQHMPISAPSKRLRYSGFLLFNLHG